VRRLEASEVYRLPKERQLYSVLLGLQMTLVSLETSEAWPRASLARVDS